jgi:hypothetical protein
MAWSYRKRIKIIPGVHLNLSKSGISTSIGVKGASITFGSKGTHLNTSIPGTGLYNRQKLSGGNSPIDNSRPAPQPGNIYNGVADNIFSADPAEITSQNMEGVKQAILASHQQRVDLNNDLKDVEKALAKTKRKLTFSYVFIYGLFISSVRKGLKTDIDSQKEAAKQIKEQVEISQLKLDFEFGQDLLIKYGHLVDSFRKLSTSQKIWDVRSAYHQDRVAARSSASTIVTKKEVRLEQKEIPGIKSNIIPLYFQNANGADLYFFPNFVVVYSEMENFAVLGIEELQFKFTSVRFVETGTVPADSKVIDQTWAKVNKNGSPDRRFSNNYQIPIVRYGNISLKTATGLNEEYEFSNYEFCNDFSNSFITYQEMIRSLRHFS